MTGKRHLLLATFLLLLLSCGQTATTPPNAGEEARPGALPQLGSPPQEVVRAAIEAPLTRHNRHIKGGAHTSMGHHGGAPVILAAAALAGNRSADQRLLEQMRYTITGGNDITGGGGYPAQHERHVTAMYATSKLTPRIWNQLTEEERRRIDLLMTAALVSSAFTYAKGDRQGEFRLTSTGHGLRFTRPLWEEVVRPFHRQDQERARGSSHQVNTLLYRHQLTRK